MIRNRRDFLYYSLAAIAAARGAKADDQPRTAKKKRVETVSAPPVRSVIAYPAAPDAESCLDQMGLVGEQLGADVEEQLRLVVDATRTNPDGSPRYAVIFDPDQSAADTRKLVKTQDARLKQSQVGNAALVPITQFRNVFNVRYGDAVADLDAAKGIFEQVYRGLGPDVGKSLAIERAPSGQLSVVYRSLCEEDACEQTLQKQAVALERLGLKTTLVPEHNRELVYTEASYLHEVEGANEATAAPPPAIDPALINSIRETFARRHHSGEKWACLIMDVKNGRTLAQVNELEPLQCASMVKPFLALAFFDQVREGKLKYTEANKHLLEEMLRNSSNWAADYFFDLLGGPEAVQALLKKKYGDILEQLEIVEKIPLDKKNKGRTYNNKASALDYARLMMALHSRRLPGSQEILRVMALSKKRNRLYTDVKAIPKGTLVYDKTGTTAQAVNDMGIISPRTKAGSRRPYVIVVIIQSASLASPLNSVYCGNTIREISGNSFTILTPAYGFVEKAVLPSATPRLQSGGKTKRRS